MIIRGDYGYNKCARIYGNIKEISNIEKTKVITMDSLEKEQKKAIVTSDTSVKSSTNFISTIG